MSNDESFATIGDELPEELQPATDNSEAMRNVVESCRVIMVHMPFFIRVVNLSISD